MDELERLCRALGASGANELPQTMASLLRIGAPAVEPLCRALEDEDWTVRWRATDVRVRLAIHEQ